MDNPEMYKIHYQAGQGKIEVISVLEKQKDSWVLCKNQQLEELLVNRCIPKKHHNSDNKKIGYGQIVVGANFNYITGSFEIPLSSDEKESQSIKDNQE